MLEEQLLKNKTYSYLFFAFAVMMIFVAIISGKAYVLILSSVFVLASAIAFSSGHIINNFLVKRSLVIEVYNKFYLSSDLHSAVKKIGGAYLGISVASIAVKEDFGNANERFREVLNSIGEPFSFEISVSEIDRKRLLEGLETRKRMREIALSRMGTGHEEKTSKLSREIEVLENDIKNITGGPKALDVSVRIRSVARAFEKSLAGKEAYERLVKVSDTIGTVFGTRYEILQGEDLLAILEAGA